MAGFPVPFSSRRKPNKQFVGNGNDFLNKHLLVVSLSKWTYVKSVHRILVSSYLIFPIGWKTTNTALTNIIAGGIAAVALRLLKWDDFKGSQRGRSRLSGDHPSEPRHRPCAYVVIVSAHFNTEGLLSCLFFFHYVVFYYIGIRQELPDTKCFSESMIFVTGLRWTVKVWKSCGPDPTVSGCCTMTRTAPELVP